LFDRHFTFKISNLTCRSLSKRKWLCYNINWRKMRY